MEMVRGDFYKQRRDVETYQVELYIYIYIYSEESTTAKAKTEV